MSTYIERYLYIYKHYILYSVHISCEYIYNIYTSTCAHGRPPLGSMSCPSWALSSWECCSKEFAEISSGNVCLTSFSSERHVCECHLLTVFCSGLVPCFFLRFPRHQFCQQMSLQGFFCTLFCCRICPCCSRSKWLLRVRNLFFKPRILRVSDTHTPFSEVA